jgi:ABC-type branched-subunit amino acid transport system ATPase component
MPWLDAMDAAHTLGVQKRDTLAMNLTYAEQRALEIGITMAGGAEGGVAR